MWVALYIGLFWIALAIVSTIGWGIWLSAGLAPYWREVRAVFAPSNVSEHGDLSEGR